MDIEPFYEIALQCETYQWARGLGFSQNWLLDYKF